MDIEGWGWGWGYGYRGTGRRGGMEHSGGWICVMGMRGRVIELAIKIGKSEMIDLAKRGGFIDRIDVLLISSLTRAETNVFVF
jgi:hypothetical protein